MAKKQIEKRKDGKNKGKHRLTAALFALRDYLLFFLR
jgi:hypothetical protein